MRRQQEEAHLINDKIRVKELRLVGDNVEQGVYPLAKAKELAEELELDLVLWIIKNSYTNKRKNKRN